MSRPNVSVPLRGKGRDQHMYSLALMRLIAFPSPCGEKVGINLNLSGHANAELDKFPSPCGEKVGINPIYSDASCDEQHSRSFRPLAGKR